MSMLDIIEDFRKKRHPLLRQNADFTNQARDGTGCESTSAEAEEEDFVARFVVGRDEVVSLANIFRKT